MNIHDLYPEKLLCDIDDLTEEKINSAKEADVIVIRCQRNLLLSVVNKMKPHAQNMLTLGGNALAVIYWRDVTLTKHDQGYLEIMRGEMRLLISISSYPAGIRVYGNCTARCIYGRSYVYVVHDVIFKLKEVNNGIETYDVGKMYHDLKNRGTLAQLNLSPVNICDKQRASWHKCCQDHAGWCLRNLGQVQALPCRDHALGVYRGWLVDSMWAEYRAEIKSLIEKLIAFGNVEHLQTEFGNFHHDIMGVILRILCLAIVRPQIQ